MSAQERKNLANSIRDLYTNAPSAADLGTQLGGTPELLLFARGVTRPRKRQRPAVLELRASLPIVTFSAETIDSVLKKGAELSDVWLPTGYWQHQVAEIDGGTGYARSEKKVGSHSHTVRAFSRDSPLASKLEGALKHLRKVFGPNRNAALVTLPAYRVSAVALPRTKKSEHTKVYVFAVPERLQGWLEGQLFDAKVFCGLLSQLGTSDGLDTSESIHKP